MAGLDPVSERSVTPTTKLQGDPNSKADSVDETDPDRDAETTITPRLIRVKYFGDYKYDEERDEIARGGMGVVYRARQVSLDRMVALKMILPNKLDTELIKRFRQEVESAGNLDHPNIVPIYEVGEHEGHHYYSMRLIDGTDLKRALPKYRKDRRAAARLMATIARAIQHAHQRGVLHRDLKPHNILVDREGQPHVADFGLAKRLNAKREITLTDEWAGTLEYMPPEQARGEFKGLTTAADIYSLGAMFYQVITGSVPFTGTKAKILNRIVEEDPPKPRSFDRSIDADLETICLKCLEKEPGRRYATAGDLANDLERWLDGKPIAARPTSRREQAVKWMRRKPAIAFLTAAVFFVAVLGVLGVVWQWRSAVHNAQIAGVRERDAIAARNDAQSQRNAANKANHILTSTYRKAAQSLADFQLERGLTLLERDDPTGLLWMARALETAPSDDADRQYVIRLHLGSWNGNGKLLAKEPRMMSAEMIDGLKKRSIETGRVELDNQLVSMLSGLGINYHQLTSKTRLFSPYFSDDGQNDAVAISPDGQSLLTGSDNNFVRLWKWVDTTQVFGDNFYARTVDGRQSLIRSHPLTHRGAVNSVTFSPDGIIVLTGSEDKTARLWRVSDGLPIGMPLKHEHQVDTVVFSPDGRALMTVSGSSAYLWNSSNNYSSNREIKTNQKITFVLFSRDGDFVLTGSDDHTAKLWRTIDGTLIGRPLEHEGQVTNAAYSPDGKSVLTGSKDGTLRLWSTADGSAVGAPFEHAAWVKAAMFSSTGDTITSIDSTGTIRRWRSVDHRLLEKQRVVDDDSMTSAIITRDAKTIVTVSSGQVVQTWIRVGTNYSVFGPSLKFVGDIKSLAFSQDGESVVVAGKNQGIWQHLPRPIAGNPRRVALWAQTAVRMEFVNESDIIRYLDEKTLLERDQELKGLGGPPIVSR